MARGRRGWEWWVSFGHSAQEIKYWKKQGGGIPAGPRCLHWRVQALSGPWMAPVRKDLLREASHTHIRSKPCFAALCCRNPRSEGPGVDGECFLAQSLGSRVTPV